MEETDACYAGNRTVLNRVRSLRGRVYRTGMIAVFPNYQIYSVTDAGLSPVLRVGDELRYLDAAQLPRAWERRRAPCRDLYLGFPPPLGRRRSRPASECATERARLRIAQRTSNVR